MARPDWPGEAGPGFERGGTQSWGVAGAFGVTTMAKGRRAGWLMGF